MITLQSAREFCKLNHPCFAGYLHDGEISELDLLATIFYLFKGNYLVPIFKENNLNSELIAIKKNSKTLPTKFDEIFVRELFTEKNEIKTINIGNKIKSSDFKFAMNYVFEKFSNLKAHNRKFSVQVGNNSKLVLESIPKSKKERGKQTIPLIGMLLYFLFSLFMLVNDSNTSIFAVMIFGFVAMFFALVIYLYYFGKHNISFDLSDEENILKLKKGYKEMYDFLNKYPLNPHYFTNEFLPFSIAFGIDQSWNKNFGLDKYTRVHF